MRHHHICGFYEENNISFQNIFHSCNVWYTRISIKIIKLWSSRSKVGITSIIAFSYAEHNSSSSMSRTQTNVPNITTYLAHKILCANNNQDETITTRSRRDLPATVNIVTCNEWEGSAIASVWIADFLLWYIFVAQAIGFLGCWPRLID